MIKIEITKVDVIEKQGKRGPYFKQVAYAHTLDREGNPKTYPERCLLILSKDDHGQPRTYPPGMYRLSPQSIQIGQFASLEVGFPTLIPVAAEQKKAS
jgi:hypothetical protein